MNALGRAAQPLIPELERYNIRVYMTEYRIEWTIEHGTWEIQQRRWLPVWVHRRMLRKLIAIAKEYEGRV